VAALPAADDPQYGGGMSWREWVARSQLVRLRKVADRFGGVSPVGYLPGQLGGVEVPDASDFPAPVREECRPSRFGGAGSSPSDGPGAAVRRAEHTVQPRGCPPKKAEE
jgi:hypothetical protein